MLSTGVFFKYNNADRKMDGNGEKTIYHTEKHKKASMAILMSNKVHLNMRNIQRKKDEHFITRRGKFLKTYNHACRHAYK